MSTTNGRRRPRSAIESDDHGDNLRHEQSSTRSESSKRARTNGYQSDRASVSPELDSPRANGYRNDEDSDDEDEGGAAEFKPGAIIRVKLRNFVTYESAEFFPGPSMNMVIGPNGTGKSSLVCAICIGLGYSTALMGRAKDFGEFVKKGTEEGTIEIELCKRPQDPENHIIRVRITKSGSNREWWLNGKKTSMKAVQILVRDLCIQIDNLCQFLPQEKVHEFSGMSPIALLEETQRAAATPDMLEMHEKLKNLRKDQKSLDIQVAGDREILHSSEKRLENLQGEVQKLQARLDIQDRIKYLERTIPFVEYRAARDDFKAHSQIKKQAQRRLRSLEAEVEPTMQRINAKSYYFEQISEVVRERKKAADSAEREADSMVASIKSIDDEIKEKDALMGAQREAKRQNKSEVQKHQKALTDLKAKLHEEKIVFDAGEWNDRIRAKEHEIRDVQREIDELKARDRELQEQGRVNRNKAEEMKRTLAAFDTQEGQQMSKLESKSHDAARAWAWVQANRDKFKDEVYGPPLVTCSLKDNRYANAVEALLNKSDFLAFTTQSLEDYKKLSDELNGKLGLADITIRSTDGPTPRRSPLSRQEMEHFGLDAWAIDLIDGPEPVLSMLCTRGLDTSAVALGEMSQELYDQIKDEAKLNHWATNSNVYTINRRKEYGPGAVSSTSKQVNPAQNWTDQPIDTSAKQEIQRKIDDGDRELEELKQTVVPIRASHQKLEKQKIPSLRKDVADLRKEKGDLQRADGEQKSLPGKIARSEGELEAKIKRFEDIEKEVTKINTQHDHAVLRKAKLAMEYKDLVSNIRSCHEALLEAKVRAIEAESDVKGLEERSIDIVRQLNDEKRLMNEAQEQLTRSKAIAHRAMALVTDLQADPENANYLGNWQNLSPDLTVENLTDDITAEKTKLQFTHANNPNAIKEFEKRQEDIEKLRQKIDDNVEKLERVSRKITKTRDVWEPRLDALISEISDAFSHNFEQIGCAGEVGVHKDEDFGLWAIQIKVKFRENEALQILDAHRQSGGERSVSTIFYLMSLQALAQAPFRVVDEINQGMDPRNERMVHERMVEIACKEHTSQYFLITPKLLTGLRYDRRMKVLCIASGAWMPTDYKKLDVNKIISIKRGLTAAAAG
ncbi:hypothetical protein LZ554_001062 [Drepanopeziza brunnea f. sp. 'monogermtubi']|nr:hypothetical protein LZ554_001062 [Drepanopeziza brunnea f. sp. 'monogermtubi']